VQAIEARERVGSSAAATSRASSSRSGSMIGSYALAPNV
jgi:hypothetical protein